MMSRHVRARRQRGSLMVQLALFLSVTLLILGIVDLGYSFYAKRDLQRIADLAAIEAVQGSGANDTAACEAAGLRSVVSNWPAPIASGPHLAAEAVRCGEWNAARHPGPRHFLAGGERINAAQVVLEGESPRFVPGPWSRRVRAEAIAQRTDPASAFQVGAQLLNLQPDAALGRLLTLIGLDVGQLTLLDSEGLANARITPAGLLEALGVDLGIEGLAVLTAQQLADLNSLTLLQILEASLAVLSDHTLEAGVRASIDIIRELRIEGVRLLDTTVPLLGDSSAGTHGIFTFLSLGQSTSPNLAALDAQVNLGAVLNTAIMLAAQGHALQIQDTSLLGSVKLGLTVVEPPTIAVGPPGTTGHSAQVRLDLDIDSRGLPLLGNLLDLLGVRIRLPIRVEGVSATGTLLEDNGVNCRAHPPTLDMDVASRIAGITIGYPELGAAHPDNLLIKTPLSLDVRGPISVDALASRQQLEGIAKGESQWTDALGTPGNPLLPGNLLDSLADAIFQLLGGLFSPPILHSGWQGMSTEGSATATRDAQIEALAKLYLEESKSGGFYRIDPAIDLLLHGRGSAGADGYLARLVTSDFSFANAIPRSCLLVICAPAEWSSGTFSQAFKAYTSTTYGVLDLVGVSTLGNGYTSCAGLLSSLLAWNSCVLANLNNLLKQHHTQVNLTDANALVDSLKNTASASVTCNGALCVLLKPVLDPLKALLNGVGRAILSPLLDQVLGLELGRSEVRALDINCNTAELVF
ncbi:TadG family pilus assembly protein [Comamonas endophytica]|uniref:Pilus assembly protein TadG-related protein n=1 Tax=Comamonas endophytica TaxID=2949090 RepID=A0ABY6GA35_9BURK|nr:MULTISPECIES: TadG family pilus assembly protein [unclassified Acidovorax]MCD2512158.1 pilus assembly protein TadG-related protein [Acidovorax sp. D4N7]UYG51931.1 pilus assembly protein TadG-related protein [Acidovorax sp. 5MLIR]